MSERGRHGCWPRRWWLAPVVFALALWLVVLALLVLPVGAKAAGSVYVGNVGSGPFPATNGTVSQYDIDPLTGGLSPKTPATVADPSGPTGVAVTPDGKSAYVTNQSASFPPMNGTVSEYNIDPLTGALSPKTPATVAAGLDPFGIAVAPDGRSTYVVNVNGTMSPNGNTVSQYDIDPVSGGLSPKSPATVATGGSEPIHIAVAPDGKSAYVTNSNSNTVSQYNIDPVSGGLSPKTPATVAAGNPVGVAVTPDGKSAYVTDAGNAGIVSQYNIDPSTGALSPKTPATVGAGMAPIGIAVTPNGNSAYVANGNDANISQYDIDPLTGALSPKTPATVAGGDGPIGVAVTADSKNAYVTNLRANTVSQYSIDPVSGALSPKTPAAVATGGAPVGVAVGPLPGVPTSKEQCKHGAWRNFPQFRNQGECVSFVQTGK